MKRPYWTLPLLLLAALQAAASEASPAKIEKKQRMVCSDAPATGSHLRRRGCVTQAQAVERRSRDQDELARMRSKQATSGGAAGR